ncbi:MAG: amidohydrolase [Pseudomonadota bacterium]
MGFRTHLLIASLAWLASACAGIEPVQIDPADAADLILVEADIRTVDPLRPGARALAVKDGRFIAVGSDAEIKQLASSETEIINANDATVLPGLIDGHSHLFIGLRVLLNVDLYGDADKASWLSKIEAKANTLSEGEWVLGGRWDHSLIGGEFPTKEDLDRVAPNNPVFLQDVDGHSAWANSRALAIGGITADTLSPAGGDILRDPDTGEPTGILLETAKTLITDTDAYIQGIQLSDEERLDALAQVTSFANSVGLTAAHEMASVAAFSDYQTLLQSGRLNLRIWYGFRGLSGIEVNEDTFRTLRAQSLDSVAAIEGSSDRGPMLVPGYVKYWIDGVLSSRTAVMLAPYSDSPKERGLPTMVEIEVLRLVKAANAAGFPVAVHAIGDGAVRTTLNVFRIASNDLPLANRIEHIEVLHPDDLGRFADENVIASVNPHHATTTFNNYLTERIGEAREGYAYPYGLLHASDAAIVLGSDWPTAPLEPLTQIWAATFRESALGLGSGMWHPENALTFEQALHGYTQAGADAAGWGDELGSITSGKRADFVILDGTIETPVQPEIQDMQVRSTYVSGESVFELR